MTTNHINLDDFFCSPDLDSDSECSQNSCQSVRSEKTLLEKLEILTNQGLIQVVKIFVDWLRANTDIILMCAQVRNLLAFYCLGSAEIFWLNWTNRLSLQSSQSLWNRLSVLLNLLPDGKKLLESGLLTDGYEYYC